VLEYAALPFFVCTRPVHFYLWEAVDNSAHALYFLYILKSAVVARYYVGISTSPHTVAWSITTALRKALPPGNGLGGSCT